MKKSIIMTLVLALIISLATVVNAALEVVPATAEVTLSKDVALKGDEITATITVKSGEGVVDNADFTLTYDPAVLEYVSSNAKDVEKGNGSVRLLYLMYGETTFTATFKVVGEKGTKSSVTFVPTQLTTTGVEYEVASASDELTVGPVEDEPTEPTEPTEPEVKDPVENEKPAEDKKEEDGKPSEIPQAGVNIAVVGGVVVALVAVAAIAKKIND